MSREPLVDVLKLSFLPLYKLLAKRSTLESKGTVMVLAILASLASAALKISTVTSVLEAVTLAQRMLRTIVESLVEVTNEAYIARPLMGTL